MLTVTNAGSELAQGLRAGDGSPSWSLTQAAEKGSTGMSGVNLEDPTAALTLRGLSSWMVDDSDATPERIYAGFVAEEGFGRTEFLRTEDAREFDISLADLNTLLSDLLFTDKSANRPAELALERYMWLMTTPQVYGIGVDPAMVDWTDTTSMPKADYRGRGPIDVMNDIVALSSRNFYVYWGEGFFLAQPPDEVFSETINGVDVVGFGGWSSQRQHLANGTTRYVTVSAAVSGVATLAGWGVYSDTAPGIAPWTDYVTGSKVAVSVFDNFHDCDTKSASWRIGTYGFVNADDTSIAPGTDKGWSLWYEPDSDGGNVDCTWNFGWRTHGSPPAKNDGDSYTTAVNLWDSRPGPILAYHPPIWANNTATMRISNDLDDWDGATTFAPLLTNKANRDPSQVYSGCYFEHGSSTGAIYVQKAATLAAFFPEGNLRPGRDVRGSDANCTSAIVATALANANLDRCAIEEDRFTLTIEDPVPSESVNLVRQGQRIFVKLTHVPGYETGAYLAVLRKTIEPLVYGLYRLTLEVGNPVFTSYHGAGAGAMRLPIRPAPGASNHLAVLAPSQDPIGAMHGQNIARMLIATGDGASTDWYLTDPGTGDALPYIPASLKLWCNGIRVTATELDPPSAHFGLDFTPVTGERIEAEWQAD